MGCGWLLQVTTVEDIMTGGGQTESLTHEDLVLVRLFVTTPTDPYKYHLIDLEDDLFKLESVRLRGDTVNHATTRCMHLGMRACLPVMLSGASQRLFIPLTLHHPLAPTGRLCIFTADSHPQPSVPLSCPHVAMHSRPPVTPYSTTDVGAVFPIYFMMPAALLDT